MEAVKTALCEIFYILAGVAIAVLFLVSIFIFSLKHIKRFRNFIMHIRQDEQTPFDIIDNYRNEGIPERIKNVNFLYKKGGLVDTIVNSEDKLYILYRRLDNLEKNLSFESKLSSVLFDSLLVSISASLIFQNVSADDALWPTLLVLVVIIFAGFTMWWHFRDNKATIELDSVRYYEKRLLREKIQEWENLIKLDERCSNFYDTKMHILKELLLEERGEGKLTVDKKETKKHIKLVRKWNVSKYNKDVDKHIILSIMGESFWFPGEEKIMDENEQTAIFLIEENKEIYRILIEHDLVGRNPLEKRVLPETEEKANPEDKKMISKGEKVISEEESQTSEEEIKPDADSRNK